METTTEKRKAHHGHNTKRLREILGMKQETLAEKMGVSQQTVSRIEQTEVLDEKTLTEVATALHIPIESIKNFTEEATYNIVANSFHDNSTIGYNNNLNFNPIEKVVELYERMLQIEKEKYAVLEEMLKKK